MRNAREGGGLAKNPVRPVQLVGVIITVDILANTLQWAIYCYQKETPMGGDLARQLSQSIKLVIALNLLLPTVTN